MTSSRPPILDEAETLVRRLADTLTRPRSGECLCCFVARMVDEYGCDGQRRHALRYRDTVAPRATALADRLGHIGACCDCELFLNGYEWRTDGAATPWGTCDDVATGTDRPVSTPPPCAGVRRGSTRSCANWVRIRRGW